MTQRPAPAPAPPVAAQHLPSTEQAQACDVCGNTYAKSFSVTLGDRSHSFDCFECAIHLLAPRCAHCHCRVIGHGIESQGVIYCCAHCARRAGTGNARDRMDGD